MANNYQKINQRYDGFTLIELILYVSLSAIILLAVSALLALLISVRVKSQTIAEVEQSGIGVVQLITQTIRNAQSVNAPAQGVAAASLSLNVFDVSKNPTLFNLAGSTIEVKEGGNSPISLTSSKIVVSGLNFSNLSRSGTPATIRIAFTLTHINPQNRNEFQYSKTFYGSANLRQ